VVPHSALSSGSFSLCTDAGAPPSWKSRYIGTSRAIAIFSSISTDGTVWPLSTRVTGKDTTETIPKSFLLAADDIVIVDVPPDLCLSRQGEKLTSTGISNSQERKLSELRELALLLTAEVVDAQLETYVHAHGIEPVFGTHERFLVGMTPHSNALAMIESGKRNKERFQGEIYAVYVCEPGRSKRESRFEDTSTRRKRPEPPPKSWKATTRYPRSSTLRFRNASRRFSSGTAPTTAGGTVSSVIRCSASFARLKVSTSESSPTSFAMPAPVDTPPRQARAFLGHTERSLWNL
jgi:Osmosensitive K+ channel His kinase sensor domain